MTDSITKLTTEVTSDAQLSSTNLTLDEAYRHAERITRTFSKSFYLASALLPPGERRAIRALYGFCRLTDNLVDDPGRGAQTNLNWWRSEVFRDWRQQTQPVLMAWAHAREQYSVPQLYQEELIEGCEYDLIAARYASFGQLERYCYCVASTVGLMAIHILGLAPGFTFEQAHPFAVKLGVALQLTNILRDVGEDAARGRIYLPADDMQRFGVTEDDVMHGRLDARMIALLRFEIERAQQVYRDSWPGIAMLARRARFAVAAAAEVYRAILNRIAANRYDVFTRRASVSGLGKLGRLPSAWLRARQSA